MVAGLETQAFPNAVAHHALLWQGTGISICQNSSPMSWAGEIAALMGDPCALDVVLCCTGCAASTEDWQSSNSSTTASASVFPEIHTTHGYGGGMSNWHTTLRSELVYVV